MSSQQNPSPRELEILKVLWEIAPASVREVHDKLGESVDLAYNTVQTQLRIMDDKGLVAHTLRGRTFVYTPRHTRERETSRMLDKVFDGALDQFVLSLLKSQNPSAKELAKLEQIIAEARKMKGK